MNYDNFQNLFYFSKLNCEELLILLSLTDEPQKLSEIKDGCLERLKKMNVNNPPQFERVVTTQNIHRITDKLEKMGFLEKSGGRPQFYTINKTNKVLVKDFIKWLMRWRKKVLLSRNVKKTIALRKIEGD